MCGEKSALLHYGLAVDIEFHSAGMEVLDRFHKFKGWWVARGMMSNLATLLPT